MKTNALNWFELFVADFDRAKSFYEAALATPLTTVDSECKMALFPYSEEQGVGGCLTLGCPSMDPQGKPGPGGTMIYLNVEGELDAVISQIPAAGGEVLKTRTDISPHGFIGIFKDTEGNIVGLHSMS